MVLHAIRLGRSVNTGKVEGLLGYLGQGCKFYNKNIRYVHAGG